MDIQPTDTELAIVRYPETTNSSLQAWSAADEHLLKYIREAELQPKKTAIYHDRFGYLCCHLEALHPMTIVSYKSQEKAIRLNMEANALKWDDKQQFTPLDALTESIDLALMKLPKSLDLFKLYLHHLCAALAPDGMFIGAFMTRHFTTQVLDIAGQYFEEVEQSRAWKKSRVLICKKKKPLPESTLLNKVMIFGNVPLQQYFGVFSGNRIDPATRFLIENLEVLAEDNRILDLGCGNGALSYACIAQKPDSELHLTDDSFLAIESAKLNLRTENIHFHHTDTLDGFENDFFDLVVCNPPFHFEYETNIEVSIRLFQQVAACLKPGGRFLLVASHHLNFKTHLQPLFPTVNIIAESNKFLIYECK